MTAFQTGAARDGFSDVETDFSQVRFVKKHTKLKHETLMSLAQSYFGAANLWPMIWMDNEFIDNPTSVPDGAPLLIRRGDRINASDRSEAIRIANVWLLNPGQRGVMVAQRRRDIMARRAA
ncbi:hypothetical protein [Terrarubrum flagellatum]|uniref:hypothetical protein n=1 Tax=Terrirubrum flagellatum TaxID=2895980 RepID=UPI0031451E52